MPLSFRMPYYVYILASRKGGTLYIGVTNDIHRRVWEHKEDLGSSFAKKYKVRRLVYLEEYESISQAIQREKRLKEWKRQWKIELIEKVNPDWNDLFKNVVP